MTRPVDALLLRAGLPPEQGLPLFTAALTHASAEGRPHYERLEYLGDAVLKLVVSEWLYARMPALDEGEMTQVRARCVSDAALARAATALDLGPHLILGASEKKSGGRLKPSILASAFEALIGAVHLVHGPERAAGFLATWLKAEYEAALPSDNQKAAPTLLQEWAQRAHQCLPAYEVAAVEGATPHQPLFEASVTVAGRLLGRATGSSKRIARAQAAEAALGLLQQEGGQLRA
ncbi:MAG: ribonuclease III [Candidatus Sericytochromatia bacterium]|nr:ribonuclease III [Candidatus Sericytochromatia bacterium]